MATLSASTNHDETTPKRGRGRPRKNTSTSTPAAKTPSTRGRGRPPKSVSAVKKTPSTNNATKPRGRPRKTLTAPSPVRTPISKGRGRPRKDGASSSKLRGAGPTQVSSPSCSLRVVSRLFAGEVRGRGLQCFNISLVAALPHGMRHLSTMMRRCSPYKMDTLPALAMSAPILTSIYHTSPHHSLDPTTYRGLPV